MDHQISDKKSWAKNLNRGLFGIFFMIKMFMIFILILVITGVFIFLKFFVLDEPENASSMSNDAILIESPKTEENLTKAAESNKPTVKIGGKIVEVDIARTPDERAQGLSGRSGLAADEGLFFIFETPAKHGFWMKDMLFPIDIIWLDSQKRIAHIEKNVSPTSYPEVFLPNADPKYVLEVQAGFSDEAGIKLGDQVEFPAGI